jgi:hypothetical protein
MSGFLLDFAHLQVRINIRFKPEKMGTWFAQLSCPHCV